MPLRERILRRQKTLRFFARKGLAKLPYLPVPVRAPLGPGATLNVWWSYMSETNIAGLPLTEYWSADGNELRFLWNFLRPGMSFFDVGAHHGMYSVVAAKKLSSQGQVIAFEPSLRERRRLMVHLHMNGVRVRVEPYAITSVAGTFPFFIVRSGFTSMNSLALPPIQNPVTETKVNGISLDRYLIKNGIKRVDLVKIDIEGGELGAFQGARRMLESLRPVIICEVLDWVTGPWGYPAAEIVEFLGRFGYQWFDFCEDGTLATHNERDRYPEIRNYLAVPRENIDQIREWRRT